MLGEALQLPFVIVKTSGMLMNYVRCDCIEERAIVGSENRVSESELKQRWPSHDDKCSRPCLEIIF